MLRTIDRYIIKKFLGTYIFITGIIILIVVVFDAAEKAQQFMAAHIPFRVILVEYYLNFIPFFVNQFSGLLTFISVIFFTSKMAYDTEIIAILSSGVSFRRLMWPYFVSSFIIAAFSLTLNMFVIPKANEGSIAFETEYRNKNKGNAYVETIYRQLEPNTFAYIRNYHPNDKTAGYLAIETYERGRIVSSVEAATVKFNEETQRWTASKYITRHFDGENDNFQRVNEPLDTVINITGSELGQVENLARTLNSFELSKFIKQQRAKGSDMVVSFEIEHNGRFAYPISTFILTLIGVSLSSRKVRGGTGLHIGLGITLCFSYIVLMRFTGKFAEAGTMPAWLAVWLPNFIYLFIGMYLYRKAPK